MLKRIIIFMLVGVLSLTLIPAYALGNDWTFTPLWYDAVLSNAYVVISNGVDRSREGRLLNLFSPSTVQSYSLVINDVVQNYPFEDNNYIGAAISFNGYRYSIYDDIERLGCNIYDITFPFNVRLEENQTLNFRFFQIFEDESFFPSSTIRLTTAGGQRIYLSGEQVQITKYDSGALGRWQLNEYGSPTSFETEYAGNLILYNVSYTYVPEVDLDRPQGIDIASLSIYTKTEGEVGNFGFIADNPEYIALPSYVEENLVEINNTTAHISEDVKKQISQLNEIYSKLFEINANMNKNNSAATQYYQTIITPSQEQIVKQEELAQKVEEAKEQLAEIQSIIEKEPTVSYDDIESVTSQADISIDEALNNEDTKKFLELLFNNSLISTMLVAVIALATVGYVLFGKKG